VIRRHLKNDWRPSGQRGTTLAVKLIISGGRNMKTWSKPAVREQEVGLEVTSYLPAEIDLI
jgi:coenzyme PQQ precursor peptide PqqA